MAEASPRQTRPSCTIASSLVGTGHPGPRGTVASGRHCRPIPSSDRSLHSPPPVSYRRHRTKKKNTLLSTGTDFFVQIRSISHHKNCNMCSLFHLDTKLTLVMWCSFSQLHCYGTLWSFGQVWAYFVFMPFQFFQVSSRNFATAN